MECCAVITGILSAKSPRILSWTSKRNLPNLAKVAQIMLSTHKAFPGLTAIYVYNLVMLAHLCLTGILSNKIDIFIRA